MEKCINDIDREKIIKAKTPSEAKKIGRKVKIRNDWEYVKENVMYNGVKAKFTKIIKNQIPMEHREFKPVESMNLIAVEAGRLQPLDCN